jgi:CRISPR-associated protein Cmr6
MEKGILVIQKTSKGFAATIQFERDGKTKNIPVISWRPTSDKDAGKPCLFQRDTKGQLTLLQLEGGDVLFKIQQQQPAQNQFAGGAVQNSVPDIFELNKTRLPKDIRRLNLTDIDNFYLKLNKAAHYSDTATDTRTGQIIHKTPDKCKFIIAETVRGGFKSRIKANYGNMDFNQIARRQQMAAEMLCDGAANMVSFKAKPEWKMALGLGNESVYEISITLHHVYGFPYIPASGIKGVVRSYVIEKYFGNQEKKAIADPCFCDVFGCPEDLEKSPSFYKEAREGKAIFFDAFPIGPPVVEPDIMNPHYGDYYSSSVNDVKAPVDTQNPVPIHFLTVSQVAFQFHAGYKGTDVELTGGFYRGNLKSFLQTHLEEALTQHGLGAKTAVGYGYLVKD